MPAVNYGVVGGTKAPTAHEASGEWKTITIEIDSTASLTGAPTGELPEGTLLVPDTSVSGRYLVADTNRFPSGTGEQDPSQIVVLAADIDDISTGSRSVAAVIEGIWTDRYWLNNGPLAAADKALFDQRLILRWDGND